MKLEIEITEHDAAAIWSDRYGEKTGRSVESIVQELICIAAADYRRNFPKSASASLAEFRKANAKESGGSAA